ncbi:MAG TPA: T9SS type A sorting domain-containing protein, partial [Cytophagaceae bacterium]|nr:T9SS type A sorting domain-containing protein [Cytophagaceae bacterium]
MKYILSSLFLGMSLWTAAQNLILDPGAETDPLSSGWVNVAGYWVSGSEVPAHSGNYHFYAGGSAGAGVLSELYQDVNVSADAASIDAGLATFNFSVWMRSYSFSLSGWNDRGRVYVEYRDASSAVLSTYDTGNQGSSSWVQYTNARTAPVGTRTIRIRLVTEALVGSDADGYFDDLSLTYTSPMPVDLIFFKATESATHIELNWATAAETSNAFFTLEKSPDARQWKVLDTIDGAGNTQQLSSYGFTDEQPLSGVQYYRLTQTDVNGTKTSYPIISEMFGDGTPILLLYPNPAEGQLNVSAGKEMIKSLRVFSASGQLLWSSQDMLVQEYLLDWSHQPAGYYTVEVLTEQGMQRGL